MVSMKQTKKDKEKHKTECMPCGPNGEDYPYGLRVSLGPDEMDKLGMKSMPKTGTKMRLVAMVNITETNIESRDGKDRRRMSLQITDLELSSAKSMTDAVREGAKEV